MGDSARFHGVTFNNIRKALYLYYFGLDPIYNAQGEIIGSKSNDFSSEKYKYIIPMQGNFQNPSNAVGAKDTYIMYWIERDTSFTQDDYIIDENDEGWDRQKCVANILVRAIGDNAENWIKTFRHLTKRNGVSKIWHGVCGATKLEYTSPIIPRKLDYFGDNSEIAFDIRFKLYYDELVSTGWKPLEGIDFTISGEISLAE